MMDELRKSGHFTMEITLEVNVEYEYIKACGEIEVDETKVKLENYKRGIDLWDYLPYKVGMKIDKQIMEDIEDAKKWS